MPSLVKLLVYVMSTDHLCLTLEIKLHLILMCVVTVTQDFDKWHCKQHAAHLI